MSTTHSPGRRRPEASESLVRSAVSFLVRRDQNRRVHGQSEEAEGALHPCNGHGGKALQWIVEDVPPLTDEQRTKLAELLKPVRIRPPDV